MKTTPFSLESHSKPKTVRKAPSKAVAKKPDSAAVLFIRNLQAGWAALYPDDKKTIKSLEARLHR